MTPRLHRQVVFVTACLTACLLFAAILRAGGPQGSITIDGIAAIKYPTSPSWAPDSSRVAFLWDAAGRQDLYVVAPGEAAIALTDFPVDPATLQSDLGAFEWLSPSRLIFSRGGQLWTVSLTDRQPRRLAGIDGDGSFALSADSRQIAYTQESAIFASSLERVFPVRVVRLADGTRASALTLSRHGRFVAFVASRGTTDVHPLPFNGTRLRSMVTSNTEGRLGIAALHGGEPFWIPAMGDATPVGWTADEELVYEGTSADRKTRTIRVVAPGDQARTIWRDYDRAWYSPTRGPATVLSPDGTRLAFFSDRSAWTHMYVATVKAGAVETTRMTSGAFTTGYPTWSPDSRRLAYAHGDEGNQLERRISVVDVASRRITPVVSTPGVQIFPSFSPDGRVLLYQRTTFDRSLDLYAKTLDAPGDSTIRLTDSMPVGIDPADFTRPTQVSYPSLVDNKPVPATLMVGRTVDRARKNPAIVWIHGSGSDQNYLAWHPLSYRMYYSMHQYLAQQGYVILTPDYRGSSGYDRDWATGNHLDLGGNDMRDVVSGVDYLKTLDYVDPERIGVWGLSYGGFMTLQAVTAYPSVFRCAIDVAGVTDWAPRAGNWTVARLGSPAEHPDAYERSAPVRHMATLERPLLIMHGTNDTNVAFHDTLGLIDALLKLGKPFETAIYPGEPHFFRREHVLRDAWRRAEEFFDRHLKEP